MTALRPCIETCCAARADAMAFYLRRERERESERGNVNVNVRREREKTCRRERGRDDVNVNVDCDRDRDDVTGRDEGGSKTSERPHQYPVLALRTHSGPFREAES